MASRPPGRRYHLHMLLVLRLLRACFECLPEVWARGLGCGLGWLIYQLGIRRRLVRGSMQHAAGLPSDPRRRERLVRANYRHYGLSVVEFMRLRATVRRGGLRRIRWVQGQRASLVALRRCIVMTSHQGNFVLMAAAAAQRGLPLSIVIKRVRNRSVERFWVEQLAGTGLRVLFNRDSMGEILRVLRRDEVLAFIYDQHDSRGGVWVDFLGRPACAFRALPVLASRARAVVPAFIHRTRDGGHVIEMGEPIVHQPQGDEEATLRHYAQLYTDRIAEALYRHPEQWLWLHRRWKRCPADAPLSERAARLLGR